MNTITKYILYVLTTIVLATLFMYYIMAFTFIIIFIIDSTCLATAAIIILTYKK